MSYKVENMIRDIAPYGVKPYAQVHAHSTGNSGSTAQNEADYMARKDLNSGYYTHVVGNGRVIQTANVNQGAWDVGNKYNFETYAAVELIESHKTKEEFLRDYAIYCELLRDLATQGGIPVTVDTNANEGIKTHKWCTDMANTYGGHIDPYPYLERWGISKEQFAKDVQNGTASNTTQATEKQEIEEDYTMTEFAFAYKGAMFYVVGSTMKALKNGTEWNVIQAMYKQTHGGRAIVAVDWSNNAPTANAYFSICGFGEDETFQNKTTQGIEDIKKALK